MSFSKTTKIIIATIIVIGGFALFYFFQNKSDEKNMFSLGEFNLPESFFVDDETEIKFEWTDDNKGEDLIIQSDKKSYFGINKSEIYFSVSSLNKDAQNFNLRFLFGEESAKLEKIEKINSGGITSELSLSENTFVKFDSMDGFSSSLYVGDTIQPEQTNYYKAVIAYNPNTKGEFYIEAKGDKGAYGLLDPWYNSTGLVGYWSMDGDDVDWSATTAEVIDRSGKGNNGDVVGNTKSTIGKVGQALEFDGSEDYVNVGDPVDDSLDMGIADFSVSAWIKTSSSAKEYILDKRSGGYTTGGRGFSFGISTSLICGIGDGTNYLSDSTSIGTAPINDDKWHHVVVIFDKSDVVKGYIDGVYQKEVSVSSVGDINTSGNFIIGKKSYTDNDFFNGSMDEVAVFNRTLSADEISALYKLGTRKSQVKTTGSNKMKINTSTVNRLTDGLVGHWTFDGADMDWSTNTVIDRSGQGNNGTITNMSTTTSPSIGKFGQALYFNELDDVVNLGKKSILMDPNSFGGVMGASTISLWVKKTDPVGVTRYNVMTHHLGGIDYFSAGISTSGQLRTMVNQENGTNYWPLSTSEVPSGVWTHVVFIIEGGVGYKFYINGSLDRDFPYPAIRLYDNSGMDNAYLGSNVGSTTFLEGSIDDVRVYNRALSSTEISELYDMGAKKIKIR